MGKLRYGFALFMAKLSIPALRITGHNGTDFPGNIAIKICPDFLKYIKKPKRMVGITGTNGKTTTSNMIFDSLKYLGEKVTNNSLGSNIDSGIATTFIKAVSFFGREKYDAAVLEIDERSAKKILPFVPLEYLLVVNLSRDSIMRNGHPGYINWFLTESIPSEIKLILNSDDLLSADIAPNNKRVYFGIEEMTGDKDIADDILNDMRICPICHEPLKYNHVRYSSVGHATCKNCGFKSPEPDYAGIKVDKDKGTMQFGKDGIKILSKKDGKPLEFRLLNDSSYNIYNEVATITTLNLLGYEFESIVDTMENINIAKNRLNVSNIAGREFIVMMCKDKNAYACNRVFEYLNTIDGDKELVLLVNCLSDSKHWSENTCWLYDCNFELLKDETVKRIIVAGDRGLDYKYRLLLAGIDREKIIYCEDTSDIPDNLLFFENDKLYFLFGADALPLTTAVKDASKLKLREIIGEIDKEGVANEKK